MQTHVGKAPEGLEEGVVRQVPCSQSRAQSALDHSQRLLEHHSAGLDLFDDGCD